ncbi:MAG TPA: hypothetical protein VEM57_00360, partial [Candidatus Binatus sp.]|nr:hypothetical protein [Candidatus Binatus sp.]
MALVFLLGGLYLGLLDGNVSWLRTLPGDVVVSEEAAPLVTTLLQTSRIPDVALQAVRRTPGVRRVDALRGRLVSLDEGADRYTLVYLVGLRPTQDFAAPVAVMAGRARPRLGEIVVDRVLA